MTDPDLIRRVCETSNGYVRLGCEVFEQHGATFVRNTACPRRYDANHVEEARCQTPDAITQLFDAWDAVYPGSTHRRFDADPFTPPQFVARLVLEGFTDTRTLQSVLEGELQARPKDFDIREVLTNDDWAAYERLQELDWIESQRKTARDPRVDVLPEFTIYKRAKQPHVRYWLAHDDGAPRAFFSSWPGDNGLGIVEDLFTEEPFRHRGIATALIAHCVADARARGAREVMIGADPADTPKHMYGALGFRPLMISSNYVKTST